jgi:hypothetical protein
LLLSENMNYEKEKNICILTTSALSRGGKAGFQ